MSTLARTVALAATLPLAACASHSPNALAPASDDLVRSTLAEVSPDRLAQDMDAICSFGTRHTLSDTDSPTRGIGAARKWTKERFESALREGGGAGEVWFDSHVQHPDGRRIDREVEIVNVICEIPGKMPQAKDRLYYVLAHLDSRASDALDGESDAPGANDSASGVVMMIELARILADANLDATVRLMATSGEEQGLFGATLHAQDLHDRGADIRAVLNNDTVGDPYGPLTPDDPRYADAPKFIRVFAEGVPLNADSTTIQTISRLGAENDSPARTLARFLLNTAYRAHEPDLPVAPWIIYRNDRFLRGGDHTPFVRLGYPAVRFTVPYEDYNKQHQDVRVEQGIQFGDLPEYINYPYLAGVTKLNAAALIHLANAPTAPADARVIVAELTNDTTLRWAPSPEPDVAGYEIVIRATTSPTWEAVLDAGNTTEHTLDLSKDNWLFGIRAYDESGFRSPVSFPRAARE